MTAARRILSLTDFQQKMAASHQRHNFNQNSSIDTNKVHQAELISHKDQFEFASSSLKVLRAKYETQGFPNRENDPNYLAGAYRVLRFMYDIWMNEQLIDMYFHTTGEDIPAHKIAVASYSTILADRFIQFPKGEIVVVEMNNFTREILMTVLYFIYTTDIQIFDNSVSSLMECANDLGIEMLTKLCKQHLEQFNTTNAIQFFYIAKTHGMSDLQERIRSYICQHFIEIVNSPTFGNLAFELLLEIVKKDDELCISSELDLFLAIVRWIEFDKPVRLQLAPSLLRHVRFHFIHPDILQSDVEVHAELFRERTSFDMLYQAMK